MRYIGKSNPYKVDYLWEVLLRKETIGKIRKAKKLYNRTMSWVVRYCVFSLLRDKKLTKEKVLELAEKLKEKNQKNPRRSSELKRFKICLYGEDEILFQELKLRYRVSVSLIIRVALHLYLGKLLKKLVSDWELFWYGIKFFREYSWVRSGKLGVPQVDMRVRRFFQLYEYWKIPPGPYPAYISAFL